MKILNLDFHALSSDKKTQSTESVILIIFA